MDDIYFSKKRNNGSDEPFNNQQPTSQDYTEPTVEEKFNLNFAPKNDEELQQKINRRFNSGEPQRRAVPQQPPVQPVNNPNTGYGYNQANDEQLRTPRQLRQQPSPVYPANNENLYAGVPQDGGNEVEKDYFETMYENRTPHGNPQQARQPQRHGASSDETTVIPAARLRNEERAPVHHENQPMQQQRQPAQQRQPSQAHTQPEQPQKKQNGGKRKKSGKSKAAKIIISIVAIIAICMIGVFAYGYSMLGKLDYDTSGLDKNAYIDSSELASDKKVTNILFIGCDDAKGAATSRSDTMMLISIDRNNKAIKLTSFLRDSYVYIPEKGYSAKLNATCSTGGYQSVVDTIEYNFHVDIENYVLVDFDMFENVVDALGGIDVEVSQKEADFLNKNCSFVGTTEGINHFAGWQALTYCRIRHLSGESDFNRTARQRKVISSIIAKCKTSDVFNLFGQLDGILANVKTDLPKSKLISLGAGAVTSYLRYDIKQMQIPASGTWSNATVSGQGSVLKLDFEENRQLLHDFLYTEDKDEETTAK